MKILASLNFGKSTTTGGRTKKVVHILVGFLADDAEIPTGLSDTREGEVYFTIFSKWASEEKYWYWDRTDWRYTSDEVFDNIKHAIEHVIDYKKELRQAGVKLKPKQLLSPSKEKLKPIFDAIFKFRI